MKDRKKTKQRPAEEALIKSERRYQTLVASVPHGIQEMDSAGTILFANPAHHKIFGYSDQEVIGKSVLDFQVTDQAKTDLSRYLAALVEDQPVPTPYFAKNLTKDGRVIDVQVDWNYKRDHHGRVIGFIAIITDVTERLQALADLSKIQADLENLVAERTLELQKTNAQLKHKISVTDKLITDKQGNPEKIVGSLSDITSRKKLEADQHENENRYRLLFNNVYDAIFVYQLEADGTPGKFMDVNEVACKRYGYSKEEFLKLSAIDLRSPETRAGVKDRIKKLFVEKRISNEIIQMSKDGEKIYSEVNSILIELNGKPTVISIARDITERKRAQEALQEREKMLGAILAASPIGIGFARNRIIQWANRTLYHMLGYDNGFLIGKDTRVLYPSDEEYTRVDHKLYSHDQEGYISFTETQLVRQNGTILDCILQAALLDPSDLSKGSILAILDITELKKAETALKRSERRMRRILNASLDRIRQVDKDLHIIWANKAACVSINTHPEQIVGQTCYKLCHNSDAPCEGCPTIKAKESGQIERAVMYKPSVRGLTGERYWDVYCVPLINEFGDIDSYIQVSKDITEEKKAEGLINSLSQQLLQAQERERQMISYELHDRVAQDLSALKIGFDTLLDGQTALQEELHHKTKKLSDVITKAIQVVRNLSYDLRPPDLDETNIAEALKVYIEDFSESSHMRIDFQAVGNSRLSLDSESKIHLYRLVQEGLNNTHKHAQAGRAWVKLAFAAENVTLSIKDNGIGFDIKERERKLDYEKRLGLRSMLERVKLLDGRMKVKSRPGEGTKIIIRVPCKEKTRDTENTHLNR